MIRHTGNHGCKVRFPVKVSNNSVLIIYNASLHNIMSLNIVILAAGMGKRMQSDLPKVLHTLAGKPMLAHVIESAMQLAPTRITVVVGHGAEKVKADFAHIPGIEFALQQPQQGTGHAVQQAVPFLTGGQAPEDTTLVLYGDVPLVQAQTLQRLLQARGQDRKSVV